MKKFTQLWQVTLCLLLLFSSVAGNTFARAEEVADKAAKKPLVWEITGRVTSAATGQGLPGVSVVLQGSTVGVATDVDGNYSLNVPEAAGTLVFSFIGTTTQERAFTGPGVINVALADDARALQEVVVTGYTTQEKKDITSAVAVVNPKELLAVAATSVEQQLQGRAAGVTVTSSNVPGQGANVRIRGFGTLGNNDPLYIIDGVPTKDNLANFNQNDIESIQILKDATSASIYGARAGNGVIIITTKKGKLGEPKITFDVYTGVQTPNKLLEMLNTEEYGQYLWQSKKNAGVVDPMTGNPVHGQYGTGAQPVIPDYIVPSGAMEGDPRVDPANYSIERFDANGNNNPAFGSSVFQITRANKQGTDWLNEIFAPAPMRNYQLGLSGATEKAHYSFSLGHFNQESMLIHNGFQRYSIRANTDFTVKNRLRVGENLQVLYAKRQGQYGNQSEGNQVFMATRMQPIVPVYDISNNFAGTLGNNLGNARNPVAQLVRQKDNGYEDLRIFGNAFAELDLIENLTARTSFGVDGTVGRGKYAGAPDPESSEAGRFYNFSADFNYRYSWTWTNTLNYHLNLGEIHDLNVNVGTEAIQGYGESQSGFRDRYTVTGGAPVIPSNLRYLDVGNPLFQNVGGGNFTNFSLFSYFGQVNYSLMDRYLFQGILRRDASSRFLTASRYATFPAFSAGWRVSEETFMQGVPFINDLKLRAGWGQTGNQDGISDINPYQTFGNSIYDFGYSLSGDPGNYDLAFGLNKLGNPLGRWETTTSTNIGFDMSLFNNKVEVNFDWYNRQTDDILLNLDVPYALGLAQIPSYNVGSVRNQGIDLGINLRNEFANQLRYDIGLIFATYENEVTLIDPTNEDAFLAGFGLRTPAVTRTQKGYPISSFYGYIVDGIFQTEEEALAHASFPGYNDATVYIDGQPQQGVGKFKYRDLNGDNVINDQDQTFIGNPNPDFTYGLNLSLGYRNFDLTMFVQGVKGNDIFNYMRYWTDFNTFQGNRSKRILYDSWTPDNPNASLPILDENDAISSRPSSHFIEKGSYLRMKNLQLAYTVPASLISRIGLGQLRVYIQGQNLVTLTNYSGLDPELQIRGNNNRHIGVDEGVFPTPIIYMLGLNVGF